jgi:hypothetical protein
VAHAAAGRDDFAAGGVPGESESVESTFLMLGAKRCSLVAMFCTRPVIDPVNWVAAAGVAATATGDGAIEAMTTATQSFIHTTE